MPDDLDDDVEDRTVLMRDGVLPHRLGSDRRLMEAVRALRVRDEQMAARIRLLEDRVKALEDAP